MRQKIKDKKNKKLKGSILIEALLALALSSTILTVVSNAFVTSLRSGLLISQNQQVSLYLKEAQEAIKSLWYSDWNDLANDGIYHLEIIDGKWRLVSGEENLNNFIRRINIDSVYRNEEGFLATASGGIIDPSVKKITTSVSLKFPWTKTITQTFYLTRYQSNNSWQEDTLADFEDGEEDATDVSINPGFVQLAQTGGGGWAEPRSLGTVDGRYKASGICTTGQYIYLTWDRLLGGVEVFDIQSSPATPSSVSTFGTTYRPNDCTTSNGYLYVANSLLVLPSINIYNIGQNPTNPPFVGTDGILYQAGGLWATERYLFVSAKDLNIVVVYQLDQGHYQNPHFLGFFFTPQETVDLAVSGNYLYVAQKSTSRAVEIYDISINPAAPIRLATLTTLYQPTGIWTESNILYLTFEGKRGAMFSLRNPVQPRLYGYFPTVRNTADVAAYGDYGYVAGADSQLKVIEVFDLSDSKGLSGTYFVYGEYISSTFDASAQVAFNRLSWQGEEPSGTNILFQVASNNDNLNWNFVGPDGTPATFYENAGAIPLNSVLGRYFKYKIILTGDGEVTPLVDKVRVNYSL